jgi:pimeloyl-ACP methyl ester carboxylesterase
VTSADLINQHLSAGRFFEAAGVRSFVREDGEGEAVVLLHGVPTSSFLWRKVLPLLAGHGLRGVAFDLPGLGLADRPTSHDYSWSGLGRFATAAVRELGLVGGGGFHLVLHDIGGPVGYELMAAVGRDEIRSLTVLDTMVEVDVFKRPLPMELFARRGVGELWLAGTVPPAWRALMRRIGGDAAPEEWTAHLDLLKRDDGGRAFLRIMRGFERTRAKRDLYVGTLGALNRPAQVVWGGSDSALPVRPHAEDVIRALGHDTPLHVLPGAKHFLMEDHPADVADRVAALARGG